MAPSSPTSALPGECTGNGMMKGHCGGGLTTQDFKACGGTTMIFRSNFVGCALYSGKSIVDHASSDEDDDDDMATTSSCDSRGSDNVGDQGLASSASSCLDCASLCPPNQT
mmetsp:Transcript_15957/g.32985  ORF Transcript_15957/g.32985 Transcript_15957/m.32985 type:complete len:111 (-) Transcript_15957:271-603(-)|eukprot:CAMPEP_0172457936 /NCGR_PEP_ID=MMETSP1065-20121228/25169_1 /TAXON_ID=265537 /ORGANISM="Amphiprora paludosa, Strain CCMP125" /LENGTH=110 /DNA_ID=CAMNT_0013211949 /DNA_START=184 /DNA_END=516 /DNA_ORIENTATION=+